MASYESRRFKDTIPSGRGKTGKKSGGRRKKKDVAIAPDVNEHTPCRVCHSDSDHAKLLICDKCEAHYHTYCLAVPLMSVPRGDWFCDKCRRTYDDGLFRLVSDLPASFTSRFGEICWAQGGNGYGWWPSCIYDPRLTIGSTRSQARKSLGKKHLVFFLHCDDAPFDLLPDSKLMKWEEGLAFGHYQGKTARATGRQRYLRFREAFQAAIVEDGKPKSRRLQWNKETPGQPHLLPSPAKLAESATRTEEVVTDDDADVTGRRKRRSGTNNREYGGQKKSRRNIDFGGPSRTEKVDFDDSSSVDNNGEVFCRIFLGDKNVGFIQLPSTKSTFADARQAILDSLETHKFPAEWRFVHPSLGPVSIKLESKLGPVASFLRQGSIGGIGDGSIQQPLHMTIIADPLSLEN